MAFALLFQLIAAPYWVYDAKARPLAADAIVTQPSGARMLAHARGLTRAEVDDAPRFADFARTRTWTAVANERFRPLVLARGDPQTLAAFGRVEATLAPGLYRIFLGPGLVDPEATAAAIRRHAEWAAPDEWVRLERRVFNDPMYGQLWHLHPVTTAGIAPNAHIHADEAWLTTTGNATPIAILDDGFLLTHEDLAPNVLRDGSGAPVAYDFVDNDADPSPHAGDDHGTHVMGVALAKGNNGLGVSGVCPDCRGIAERVFAEDDFDNDLLLGAMSDAAEAMRFAAAHGARVINNSWGPLVDPLAPAYQPLPPIVDQAIADLVRAAPAGHSDQIGGAGVLIAWAAGNNSEGDALSLVTFDGWASDPRVMSVGASSAAAARASYSDVGPPIDLLGPSSDEPLGLPRLPTTDASANNAYSTLGGTSGASPVVAGVAALVLSVYPELTLAQLFEILLDSADRIDAEAAHYDDHGVSCTHGHGRVNAAAALALAAARQADYASGRTLHYELCGDGIDNDGDIATPDDSGACARCTPTRPDDPVDGIDNNCDGLVDNAQVCVDPRGARCVPCSGSSDCQNGLSCLAQAGAMFCMHACGACDLDESCVGGVCEPVTSGLARTCADFSNCGSGAAAAPEACDGRDNDCDGFADDFSDTNVDFTQQTALCRQGELGVCAVAAAQCQDAAWSCARPSTYQAVETLCDGLDNDCDGQVDEGCPSQPAAAPAKKHGCAQAGAPAWIMGSLSWWVKRRRARR